MPNDFFKTKIKIVQLMQKANRPLIAEYIAKKTKLSHQLVSYHLKQMVESGIAGIYPIEEEPGVTYYALQPPYYDPQWLEALYAALTPFVEDTAKTLDLEQATVSSPQAVLRNLTMFLRLFEKKIEKINGDDKSC